ncbi:hypothetical protein [Aestuariimicrobium sp. Y1814]|uniref:hypothetical protein n=1 Tax=Aestuariimicrobium sp. Y1814 TaxID=3418742 RepID=UPI003DA75D80
MAIHLGDRLGWYRALAEIGPSTAAELARHTHCSERYAREWLSNSRSPPESSRPLPPRLRLALPAAGRGRRRPHLRSQPRPCHPHRPHRVNKPWFEQLPNYLGRVGASSRSSPGPVPACPTSGPAPAGRRSRGQQQPHNAGGRLRRRRTVPGVRPRRRSRGRGG